MASLMFSKRGGTRFKVLTPVFISPCTYQFTCVPQVLGCIAMSGTILPFVEVPFSTATIARAYERRFKVPFVKVRVARVQGIGWRADSSKPLGVLVDLLHARVQQEL